MLTEDCHWTRVYTSRIRYPSSNSIYLMPIVKSNIILKIYKTFYVFRPKFLPHFSLLHVLCPTHFRLRYLIMLRYLFKKSAVHYHQSKIFIKVDKIWMDKQLHSLALRCTSNIYNRKRPDCLLSDSRAADSPHNSEAFIEIPLKAREKNELSSRYNNPRVRLPQKQAQQCASLL